MNVFLRSQFNYDTAAASDETALTCPEPSMAIQSARDDCDINTIVRRFGLTGELPTALAAPTYDDFSEVTDFHTALNAIALANEAFDQLPAEVRYRFNNNPGDFVDFCSNDSNRSEAEKLGLVFPKSPPAPASVSGSISSGEGIDSAPDR